MFSELINLIPPDMTSAFRREYFVRLAAVACLVAAAAVTIHGILLAPAYIFVEAQAASGQARLSKLSSSLNTAEEKQLDARLAALASDTAYLSQLGSKPFASVALSAILSVPRPGIHLSGFTYIAPDQSGTGHMTLSGVSDTRETLRQYVLALQAVPFISSADLPVSAYAQDKGIPFTISLAGSMTP